MGRNVVLTASPIGNLAVKRNSRTSKYKGVTTSGKGKRQARAWCTRRRKFIALGTFPNSPEAAVAVATAEAQGIESLPTPEPRKRTGRRDLAEQVNALAGQPQAPPSPCSALALANDLFDSISAGASAVGSGCEPSAALDAPAAGRGSSLPVLPAWHVSAPRTARRRTRRKPPSLDAARCAADAAA